MNSLESPLRQGSLFSNVRIEPASTIDVEGPKETGLHGSQISLIVSKPHTR